MSDVILRDLINCIEGDDLNVQKFLSLHPMNDQLRKSLVALKRQGYLALDYGDDQIREIAATRKLLNLATSTH